MTRRAAMRVPLLACLLLGIGQPAFGDDSLDLSIAVFDPGVPEAKSVHRDLKIFPRIRAVEALLLPYRLREVLAGTGEWGAVRDVTRVDAAADLSITGEILHSDGHALGVRITAVDAGGQLWIDSAFVGPVGGPELFVKIAEELNAARLERSDEELSRINEISLLRYGLRLAPTAFRQYLQVRDDGEVIVQHLPARDEPMVDRIRRIRETEYVITDTVDAKFQELHGDIASVYELWREYRRKTVEFERMDAEHAAATASAAPGGTYRDLLKQLSLIHI